MKIEPLDCQVLAGLDKRFLISDLCRCLEKYLTPEQVAEVYRAYLFGAEAHEGQHRKTGEPYIHHPLEVARILATMRLDCKCMVAAILHDVIEDTDTVKEQIAEEFGEQVAEIVDGLSKLTQINFNSYLEAQAANLRKMLLAMTRDIRVILIKLADRLHNMRTLGVMPPNKRRRIARETLEIYAPIAKRLGINQICRELEELCFHAYWPLRYEVLNQALAKVHGHRVEMVAQIESSIVNRLNQESISATVVGRKKHSYSIYKKMLAKGIRFNQVSDLYGFRIIVDSVDTCYRALGVAHNLYKPVPGKFKDYIAIPKPNGYQSLHTQLFGPNGLPLEIQIRTEDMDYVAANGIAAHWAYKESVDSLTTRSSTQEWLQSLMEMQQQSGNSLEFLENVKVDLFPDNVYVFTPRGEIKILPRGSTLLDFAYAIHSDVGNSCVAGKVDWRQVPLHTRLSSGQTVEVVAVEGAKPSAAWLNFVVTAKARSAIRAFLKNIRHHEAIDIGRRLLNNAFAMENASLENLSEDVIQDYLEKRDMSGLSQLYDEIGMGNLMPALVARQILAGQMDVDQPAEQKASSAVHMVIEGGEDTVLHYAGCCRPIPGDVIAGVFSPGRGVVVHRRGCHNLTEYRGHHSSWLEMSWADHPYKESFASEIRIEAGNQRGVLARTATILAEMGCNIENVRSEDRDGLSSVLDFVISVRDRVELTRIMQRLYRQDFIFKVYRLRH